MDSQEPRYELCHIFGGGGGGGGGGQLHRTWYVSKKAYRHKPFFVCTSKGLIREDPKKDAQMFVRVGC